MPSKSKSQQRLFGMALAVRRGELERSKVDREVLDIVDSEMTDKQIEDFAKKRTSDRERVTESLKGDKSLSKYIEKTLYAGRMNPKIAVRPDKKYVFVVIKPGFHTMAMDIIEKFNKAGFSLYKTRTKVLSEIEARQMYSIHKREPFYKDLCKYMSSDVSIGLLFEYPNDWSEKHAFEETTRLKEEIRKRFKESDMRNVLHSSDDRDRMKLEAIKYFNGLL